MNKYLLLSAAAVLASTAANASTSHTFTFATAGGTAYCDGGKVFLGVDGGALSGAVRAWTHTNNNCASATSEGMGILTKTNTLGKNSPMSDELIQKNYLSYSEQLTFTLPKKIKQGGAWTLWIGLFGSTAFEGNSGELINVVAHNTSHVSTFSTVKALIQQHRNGR